MFKDGRTGYTYYSVREKINYYKGVIAGRIDAPAETKRKAKGRVRPLTAINEQAYTEPTLIMTNDMHFGNSISKPRLGVVIDADKKNRVLVAPVNQRTTKAIVLDKQPDRQVDERKAWIDKSEIYEIKYIRGVQPLTVYDKTKVKQILRKK